MSTSIPTSIIWTLLGALALCLLPGCDDTNANRIRFAGTGPPVDQDFDHADVAVGVDTLAGIVVLDSTRVEHPSGITVSNRMLFVLERHLDPAVRVIRLEDLTTADKTGRAGSGPAEFRSIRNFSIAPTGNPWVFDGRLYRLTRLHRFGEDGNDLTRDSAAVTVQAGGPILNVHWLSDTTLIATGWFKRGRFGLFDARGNMLTEIGDPPPGDPALPVHLRNEYHAGSIAVHPSRKLFVVAKRNTGDIEIYDETDGGRVAKCNTAGPEPWRKVSHAYQHH